MEASSSKEEAVMYSNNMDANPGALDETFQSSGAMALIEVDEEAQSTDTIKELEVAGIRCPENTDEGNYLIIRRQRSV